jgi:hypothetical protein
MYILPESEGQGSPLQVADRGPSRFGRNWLEGILLDWPQLCSVSVAHARSR